MPDFKKPCWGFDKQCRWFTYLIYLTTLIFFIVAVFLRVPECTADTQCQAVGNYSCVNNWCDCSDPGTHLWQCDPNSWWWSGISVFGIVFVVFFFISIFLCIQNSVNHRHDYLDLTLQIEEIRETKTVRDELAELRRSKSFKKGVNKLP